MRHRGPVTHRIGAVLIGVALVATAACSGGHSSVIGSSSQGPSSNPPSRIKGLTAAEYRYGGSPHPNPKVTYQPDVIMTGGGAESVRSVSADGLTWTLDGHAAGVDRLTPGKIMFATGHGVGRVLAVKKVDGNVAVTIGPIQLTDLIKKADISIDQKLDPSQVVASLGVPNTAIPYGTSAGEQADSSSGTPTTVAYASPGAPQVQPADLSQRATAPEPVSLRADADDPAPVPNVPRPPGTLPPSAPNYPVVPINDFKTYPLSGSNGFGYEIAYDKNGTKVHGEARLYLDRPSIRADLVVTPSGVQTAKVSLHGATGISFDFQAGSTLGITGNIHYVLPLPVDFHIPVYVLGLPFDVEFSQTFIVSSGFSAKNATLKFGGDYSFGGDIGIGYDHGSLGVDAPVGFHTRKNLVDSINGPSIGINSFVLAYSFRVLVGLGAGGFAFGPYFSFINGISLLNGSDLAIVKCKGATYTMDLGYGVGYSMPKPVAAVINFFLRALNLGQIQRQGGISFGSQRLITIAGVEPKVKACEGADGQ